MLAAAAVLFQLAATQPSLRGVVTDPSGAVVPNATVQVRGPVERRTRTTVGGEYRFPALPAGVYEVRVTARGFPALARRGVAVVGTAVFDARLLLAIEKQTVRVDDETGRVGVEPEANGGAVTIRARQIAALSDDPDELAAQLRALSGPAPGPEGGQLFVDGFSGAAIPPKASIREIRINANPFSPEYDRPGFSRIEIFTKPGSEAWHAQALTRFNDRVLNARNPLLESPARPPYRVSLFGVDLGGPVWKNRASFTLSAEHRRIGENALIQATTPEGRVSEGVEAPQRRTSVAPRVDFAMGRKGAVSARFQNLASTYENMGVGNFNLPSRAYSERATDRTAQITATAMPGPRSVNETRAQWTRSGGRYRAALDAPATEVLGAFGAGGAPIGNSRSAVTGVEVTNLTMRSKGAHAWKWGGRARGSSVEDVSLNNFAGTWVFFTLDQYRAGRPAQFLINSGTPGLRVRQLDAGVFVNDDWKARKSVTVSLGMRYEAQTNLGGARDWAPRVAVAWGIGRKTVVRAGAGVFYDRLASSLTLNARRFDGVTQRSYVVLDPPFYPAIPGLEAGPQQLRPVYAAIAAPRIYQASAGVERQLDRASKLAVTWVASRGVHLLNTRNVNTPVAGRYPFGDRSMRMLTESAASSRIHQVVANLNATRGRAALFGYYALSWGRDNTEGPPANPYDLRAEWGPSTYADVRHRLAMGGGIPLPGGVTVSPFVTVNSGVPYNVTTGLDPLLTGFPAARPESVGRNAARGPANANLGLRISRTWKFAGEPGARGGHGEGSSRGVTVGASTLNALNTPNYAPPVGNMSSPYFGQSRALGGLVVMSHGGAPTTYNRRVDVQIGVTF